MACGSTRAALALAHGHAIEALALNPLATTAMMGGLLGGFVAPGWVALRAPVPGLAGSSRYWRIAVWGAVMVQWWYLVVAGR